MFQGEDVKSVSGRNKCGKFCTPVEKRIPSRNRPVRDIGGSSLVKWRNSEFGTFMEKNELPFERPILNLCQKKQQQQQLRDTYTLY